MTNEEIHELLQKAAELLAPLKKENSPDTIFISVCIEDEEGGYDVSTLINGSDHGVHSIFASASDKEDIGTIFRRVAVESLMQNALHIEGFKVAPVQPDMDINWDKVKNGPNSN